MNYKIRVANEAESKEAQGLFFELGYKWLSGGKKAQHLEQSCSSSFGYLVAWSTGCFTNVIQCGCGNEVAKELTIHQLRDMVVLKRNNPKDSTHYRGDGKEYFQTHDKERHCHFQDGEWVLSTWMNYQLLPQLKPITKEPIMKEFLNKLTDGTYKLVVLDSVADGVEGLIEVPHGADKAFQAFSNAPVVFKRSECGYSNAVIIWQRETLNDKVASAEVARQEFIGVPFSDLPEFNFEAADDFVESNVEQGAKHSHYKKDISHLNTLDIYRVTELFNPHSCGAHIAKKALCSGQRGHKDLLTDIQDIIDTAERWKEMLIEDEKAK
jgi:hypothetical protein